MRHWTKRSGSSAIRIAAGLMLAILCGCGDQPEQSSDQIAEQEMPDLPALPDTPPTPAFDDAVSEPPPEEDPLDQTSDATSIAATSTAVADLLSQPRAMPPPAYRQVNTYAQVGTLEGHRGAVLSLNVVGAEPQVVTAGIDGTIRLWSLGKADATKTISIFAERMVASPDGRLLLAESQGVTKIIDTSSGAAIGTLPVAGLMAISHDGMKVLSQRTAEVVDMVDLGTGEKLFELRGHKRRVQCAVFSADDHLIVTGGDATDQTVRVWDATSGALVKRLQDPKMSEAISVAISPNGRLIASVERTKVSIWNFQTGQLYRQIENADAGAYSTAAFLDGEGRRLALAQDGSLLLVDVQNGGVIQTVKAHDNPIGVMAVSRDGAMIFTGTSSMGGSGEPCKVWGDAGASPAAPSKIPRALTLTAVATVNEQRGGVGPLVSAPDGRVVYAGTSNTALTGVPGGMVNAYDALTGKLLRSFDSEIPRRVSSAASLALSPDGQLLAMGTSKGDIVIWETTSGREIASNESYSREISGLLIIEGGRSVLVLISAEQNLPVLDVKTAQETRRLFVPGGSTRGLHATSDDGAVIIGDTLRSIKDAKALRQFQGRAAVTSGGLGVSRDGAVVATVAASQGQSELRVWASNRDTPVVSKRVGEADSITLVRVSNGGQFVATVHQEPTGYVLMIRDATSLIEVSKQILDGFGAVSDVTVDERTQTVAVSGSARDGLLRMYRW